MRFVRSFAAAAAIPWNLIATQFLIWALPKAFDALLHGYQGVAKDPDNTLTDIEVGKMIALKDKVLDRAKADTRSRGGGKIFR